MDIQHTIIITIIFIVVFLRLIAFWLNFGQLKTIFAKPRTSSYSIAGGGLSALGSGQKFIEFSSGGNHKKHSAPTCFSDLQKNHLESRSFSTSITSSIRCMSPIAETKTKTKMQSSAYQFDDETLLQKFKSRQNKINKSTNIEVYNKQNLEQFPREKDNFGISQIVQKTNSIESTYSKDIHHLLANGAFSILSKNDKSLLDIYYNNIINNRPQTQLFSFNHYAATAPVLEFSNLNNNKPPNLLLYINESKALLHFLASGMIDTCGKDFDKNLKVLGIVPGRSYLCDFRLILQKKNSNELSEIAVDISCTYDIKRTLEAKCNIIKAQYNKNYPAATYELRNYGALDQPKQLYFIDLDHLQKTGHCKFEVYSVSQDGRVVDGPIASAKFSTYLEEQSAIRYVPPSDLLILDKNEFAHTKLGEPVYGIDDFNSILLSNNSAGVLRHLITF